MTSLHTKLKELRELRERASDSKWLAETSNEMNCLMRNDPETEHYFYADGCVEEDAANFKFCAAAANHWLTLIACLEKAVGALEYIRVDIKFDRKEDVIVTKCDEALAEIAAMLDKC